ncbi:galactoside 2-alpha-L-fucosyltransferase 2-like [Centruroides sculpturatus]|uniref:galactoside 2-alpha-L-fucosyltransferase 2-like n=1 Tax=Centruroides sculpturatus TaxID=218467 RepID=UPI000C6E8905|nr:galactoside 2-alpha-L-fucosyltransferase 2-like [Centruroides sculpturatus]
MLFRFIDVKSLFALRFIKSKICIIIVVILFFFLYDPRDLIYGSLWRHTKEALLDPYFLTIHCNEGRLGNQMGTYATLYGLARLNKRIPYGQQCNMDSLIPYFELSVAEIGSLPQKYSREYELGPYFQLQDENIPSDKNILTGYLYPSSFTFYHHVQNEIKREFQFKKNIIKYVYDVFNDIRATRGTSLFISVHIRRTDYCSWLKAFRGKEFDKEYILKAMQYFKNKYKNILFLLVSDDRKWCIKQFSNLPDVIITKEPPEPAYDLALLAHCNHSIITYGTFGFWGAYLAGGDTVYYANFLAPNSKFLRHELTYDKVYLPEWVGISTIENDFWLKHNSSFHPKECETVTWWEWIFGKRN